MKTFPSLVVVCLFLGLSLSAFGREWTDTTGAFKVEATLITIKDDKVYLEKADGMVVTVPLSRLSQADQAYVKSVSNPQPAPTNPFTNVPATTTPAATTPTVPVTPEKLALAKAAHAILDKACHRCHGQDGANEGGFNYVLNFEKLAQHYVKPGDVKGSIVFKRLSSADEDEVMPPAGEEPRPSASEIATIRQWIEAGAPPITTTAPRTFISNDQVISYVLADLLSTPERNRRFIRFFTLTHLYNAGMSEDELQTYRLAFAKLINSLSWNATLVVPHAIDPAKTVFRIDIRQLNWNDQTWEDITRANPYGLRYDTADAKDCYKEAQSEMPFVRVDWFVFAASKPPLYHAILGVPKTDRELEQILRVDVAANIDQEKAVRAGFNRSGVSQNNRMIERHRIPYGSYWKSYDFGGNTGRQNLFEYPMGPKGTEAFRHDGGEMIFSLPNGLQGYMLTDAAGNRIDTGPLQIVSDPKRPDRAVMNGISCMSCHYAGMITKSDEIRKFVETNKRSFTDPDSILALYPGQSALDSLYAEDGKRFTSALEQIGIKRISKTGEPISTMAMRFEEELDMKLAAAEVGMTCDEFERCLERYPTTARALGALRVSGGTVKRDAFVEVFLRISLEFGVVRNSSGQPAAASQVPLTKIKVPDESIAGEIRRFPDLGWGVKSLAFSPDGGRLAVGKMDQALILFDINTGGKLGFFEKLDSLGQVTCVTFSPDGKKLLAGGYTGRILVYEVSTEGRLNPAGQFVGHNGKIGCITVSRDGQFVLSGGSDKTLRYWRLANGKEELWFEGFRGDVRACVFSREGGQALGCDGETLMRVDLTTGDTSGVHKLAGSSALQALAISPDASRVIASDSYSLRMWNTETGAELPKFQDREIQWSAVFSPDGRHIASGGSGTINIWNVETQKRVNAVDTAGTGYVQSVAFSPDNRHVSGIPGSAGQDLQIFRLPRLD
jgi:WD40 repeat protein/mono/diheme cytochrome c family protein